MVAAERWSSNRWTVEEKFYSTCIRNHPHLLQLTLATVHRNVGGTEISAKKNPPVSSDVLEITRLRRIRARTHRAKAKAKSDIINHWVLGAISTLVS